MSMIDGITILVLFALFAAAILLERRTPRAE